MFLLSFTMITGKCVRWFCSQIVMIVPLIHKSVTDIILFPNGYKYTFLRFEKWNCGEMFLLYSKELTEIFKYLMVASFNYSHGMKINVKEFNKKCYGHYEFLVRLINDTLDQLFAFWMRTRINTNIVEKSKEMKNKQNPTSRVTAGVVRWRSLFAQRPEVLSTGLNVQPFTGSGVVFIWVIYSRKGRKTTAPN